MGGAFCSLALVRRLLSSLLHMSKHRILASDSHHINNEETCCSSLRMNELRTCSVKNSPSRRAEHLHSGAAEEEWNSITGLFITQHAHIHSRDQWLKRFIRGMVASHLSVGVWTHVGHRHRDKWWPARNPANFFSWHGVHLQKESFNVWASCAFHSGFQSSGAGPSKNNSKIKSQESKESREHINSCHTHASL